ncbi:uncharacterized protein LOC132607553 isoform X1 [Lycium barbarum]|uniref:uncharacterized protein LOC132607553 isoform X1 n=1 Tax=Lycium barbarum TaxID=112863 RepID=UPI00293F4100|nr:uncharacterized protein LOC132607553 isoform X1 [Lycium barbarum]
MWEVEVPSLITLCIYSIRDELIRGNDDLSSVLYQLPTELFDQLLRQLPPLALHKLQERKSDILDDYELLTDGVDNHRKRKRYLNFEEEWKKLYEERWPALGRRSKNFKSKSFARSAKAKEVECESADDWQQMYWEAHLQKNSCLDTVAEIALFPSFHGPIGDLEVQGSILNYIDRKGDINRFTCDHSKFAYHCQQFGSYARHLRLPNVLCVEETCLSLRNARLESLELQWIKSDEHVEGLCKLINQNYGSLKSIKFMHCKFTMASLNAICDLLCMHCPQAHGLQHFSIKTSSLLETPSLPAGLIYLLSSGRSLSSLCLSDSNLPQHFARIVFDTLIDASSSITILDLSENNIMGWLSHFKWKYRSTTEPSGTYNSLKSLKVLNLRNCNLQRDDVDCLRYALVHIPNLEQLDLSDNPIEDAGIRCLITYFTEMSNRRFPLVELKLGSCELTCFGVCELLEVLSALRKPLNFLSIGGNSLGSEIGTPLGKFLCGGLQALDIEDIGLGSSGFMRAGKELVKESKLHSINISKNRGGIETARFLAKLFSQAPHLSTVNAKYNFMPKESLSILCSAVKAAKGKLEHLDLRGNILCGQQTDLSELAEFQTNGFSILELSYSPAASEPYDDDP